MANMSKLTEFANTCALTFAIANVVDYVVILQSLDDTADKDLGTLWYSVDCHQAKRTSWLRHDRECWLARSSRLSSQFEGVACCTSTPWSGELLRAGVWDPGPGIAAAKPYPAVWLYPSQTERLIP
jgi:hypothetical protein